MSTDWPTDIWTPRAPMELKIKTSDFKSKSSLVSIQRNVGIIHAILDVKNIYKAGNLLVYLVYFESFVKWSILCLNNSGDAGKIQFKLFYYLVLQYPMKLWKFYKNKSSLLFLKSFIQKLRKYKNFVHFAIADAMFTSLIIDFSSMTI